MTVSNTAQHDALTQSGAGLGEVAGEPADAPRAGLKARLQRHRGLVVGAGVLALGAVALALGRDPLLKAARPVVAKAVRPVLAQAVMRRPRAVLREAIRRPKAAARLVASLR
jgi:hypothetical protein